LKIIPSRFDQGWLFAKTSEYSSLGLDRVSRLTWIVWRLCGTLLVSSGNGQRLLRSSRDGLYCPEVVAFRFCREITRSVVYCDFSGFEGETPEDYIDRWNLFDEVDPEKLGRDTTYLATAILKVIETPIDQRGPTAFE